MANPIETVSNSSWFYNLASYGSACLLPPMLAVGRSVCTTIGTLPGGGGGIVAVVGGFVGAYIAGKGSYRNYRDIEICDGTWTGAITHGLGALASVSLAVLGAATLCVAVQSHDKTRAFVLLQSW